MLSRTAVANHAADILISGDESQRKELVEQLAGWLKDSGRSRQSKYLVNDIAKLLSDKGYTLITISSARKLTDTAKKAIDEYLISIYGKDNKFEMVEVIDKNLIGGVLIDTPNGILDLSVKNKLMNIIKGASV